MLRPWARHGTDRATDHGPMGARVANRPVHVFPGTSRILACVSRVPAYAFPGRLMSRIFVYSWNNLTIETILQKKKCSLAYTVYVCVCVACVAFSNL